MQLKIKNKNFIPKQVIINNPHSFDLQRFHLDYIIAEAINVKNNSLSKDYEVEISKYVEILSPNKTSTRYGYSKGDVAIDTSIKKDVMEVDLKIITGNNNNEE